MRRARSCHCDDDALAQRARGHGLTDDRETGHLTHDEQPAGGLRVGQEEQLVLVDPGGDGQVRPHPVEVATRAARDVTVRERLPGPGVVVGRPLGGVGRRPFDGWDGGRLMGGTAAVRWVGLGVEGAGGDFGAVIGGDSLCSGHEILAWI